MQNQQIQSAQLTAPRRRRQVLRMNDMFCNEQKRPRENLISKTCDEQPDAPRESVLEQAHFFFRMHGHHGMPFSETFRKHIPESGDIVRLRNSRSAFKSF